MARWKTHSLTGHEMANQLLRGQLNEQAEVARKAQILMDTACPDMFSGMKDGHSYSVHVEILRGIYEALAVQRGAGYD